MNQQNFSGVWELPLFHGKNPNHTGAFLNSYDAREFSPEEVVAREGAQNTMDAGKGLEGITGIEFHDLCAKGEGKQRLLDLLAFRTSLGNRLEAFQALPRHSNFSDSLDRFLSARDSKAMLIRDFNTCGLGGDWQQYRRSDHFARLVCALNLDDKADDDVTSGGSFGLGKTSYAKSSGIYTVVYHSTFRPSEETAGECRRLMVAGVYPKHKFNDLEYNGFAYFGAPHNAEQSDECMPFEGQVARDLWSSICECFDVDLQRDDTQYGTDILILESDLDIAKIKNAIEEYYFPAILGEQVSIKFRDQSGRDFFPNPRARQDLDQFVELWSLATENNRVDEPTRKVFSFNKSEGKSLGSLAIAAAEDDEAKSDRRNKVALLRGTGMVINYVELGSDQYEPAVGVFVAHEDMYQYLLLSENPAHSEWNPQNHRLKAKYGEAGIAFVKAINTRLSDQFAKFQKKLQPDVSVIRSETGLFASLLANALSGGPGDAPPPPGRPNPVSVHLVEVSKTAESWIWQLRLEDNEHTPEEPFTLKLKPQVSIAGDAKQVAVKHKDFVVCDAAGEVVAGDRNSVITCVYIKGNPLIWNVEFNNPGQYNYIVKFNCEALMTEVADER